MKLSKRDKFLLFEQEFVAAIFLAALSIIFYYSKDDLMFYLISLLIGFGLYFWMVHEEKVHKSGKKHIYFEHTSSYIMIGQTALVLGLLFLKIDVIFLMLIAYIISIIMYSVSISRIVLFKVVFK